MMEEQDITREILRRNQGKYDICPPLKKDNLITNEISANNSTERLQKLNVYLK